MTEGIRFYVEELPGQEFYVLLPTRNKQTWHFRDRDSEALEIHSPDPEPWGKPWVIALSEHQEYTEGIEYPHKLILTLHQPHVFEGFCSSIKRDVQKSFYCRSTQPTQYFFSFISDQTRSGYIPYWINYYFQAEPTGTLLASAGDDQGRGHSPPVTTSISAHE